MASDETLRRTEDEVRQECDGDGNGVESFRTFDSAAAPTPADTSPIAGPLRNTRAAILYLVEIELFKATQKFAPFHSAHEGYAVILEELDELWEELRKKDPSKERMFSEAIQVAAMAVRFIEDVCDG